MRVALVHDWLVTYRGGEKVLEALCKLYPDAPIYTLFYDRCSMPESIRRRQVITVPALRPLRKLRKGLLPILPRAIESFDFSAFDLILSTSSCVAKGARPGPNTKHLCYLHSPMRYIWDQKDAYIDSVKHIPLARQVIHYFTPYLRAWDVNSAARVDQFVVNSSFVGERVRKFYDRTSCVIHPPIDLARFAPGTSPREFYLLAGAMVANKRLDIAIAACNQAQLPLVVAGSGPMEPQLRKLAGPTIRFIIKPDDHKWLELLQSAKALLFPGVEDFGMVPLEAMACGTPVLAFKKGGALDYIDPAINGGFFREQNPESLLVGLSALEEKQHTEAEMIEFTKGFSTEIFIQKMQTQIDQLMKENR